MARKNPSEAADPVSEDPESEVGPEEVVEKPPIPMAQDILLRSVGRFARKAVENTMANRARDTEEAKLLIESRSLVRTVATYGVTRVATKSVPGAILVGTGLVAKMLFDRSQSRREAKRQGIANRHKSKD